MKHTTRLILMIGLIILQLPALAQQQQPPPAPPDPLETAWTVAIDGSYSNFTNASTNNGWATSQALRLTQHWAARSDQYITLTPATVLVLAEGEYRFSLAHLLKNTQAFALNFQNFEAFVNAGAGTARSQTTVNGNTQLSKAVFAYSAGGGLDYRVSDHVNARLIDVKYVRASILNDNGIVLGNHREFSAGIGVNF